MHPSEGLIAGARCLHVSETLIVRADSLALAGGNVDQPVLLFVLRGSSSWCPLLGVGVCELP